MEQQVFDLAPKKPNGNKGGRRQAPPPQKKKTTVSTGRGSVVGVGKVLYGILVGLSALIVGGYLAFSFFVSEPEVAPPPQTLPDIPTIRPVGGTEKEESQPEQTGPVVEPLVRREGVFNILLAGTDYEGMRTDTMMVASYDIKQQKVGVISVPRDTLVQRAAGENPRLVYGKGGVQTRAKEISELLGIPIDYYIKVDLSGFIALVDYVGGVDFYVPCDMDYDDPYQNLSIHYKKGMQHLNGQQAMEVSRFRKNNDGTGYTDVGRTQTQQDILVALAKKVLSWNSLTKINGFVEMFNTYVSTDLKLSDMLYFASQAIYLDVSSGVETTTLKGNGEAHYGGYSFCYALDKESTVEAVNRLVNPYTRDLTLEDMNILSGT